jgi:hypothetical protein
MHESVCVQFYTVCVQFYVHVRSPHSDIWHGCKPPSQKECSPSTPMPLFIPQPGANCGAVGPSLVSEPWLPLGQSAQFQAFLRHKNAWTAKLLVFWAQNQQRTHHKAGTARPPKAMHTSIYAEGTCPHTHRATNNRHTECAGLPWWSFGSRRARIACEGSPHTFVPSLWYKRQNL